MKIKKGNYIKSKTNPQSGQWKVLEDNGVWFKIVGRRNAMLLFHSVAKQQWEVVAKDDSSAIASIQH
jgi:hypothetical protein